MGLSDKLKQFGDKAKDAAVEHRDQINNAVQTAGVVADQRTRGKYSDKIAKATSKTEGYVERLASQDQGQPGQPGRPGPTDQPGPSGQTSPAAGPEARPPESV